MFQFIDNHKQQNMATLINYCLQGSLVNLPNKQCPDDPTQALNLSATIGWIAFQKQSGSDFDGSALSGVDGTEGGTITSASDWQAKMAADSDDKIVVIGIVQDTSTGDPTDQTSDRQPFGQRRLISREVVINFALHYAGTQTIAGVNAVNSGNVGAVRAWVMDENYNVQKFENASLLFSNLKRLGPNQNTPAHFAAELTYSSVLEPEFINPGAGNDFQFLTGLEN